MTEEEATEDFNRWMTEASKEAQKPSPSFIYLQTQSKIRGIRWTKEQREFAALHLAAMASKHEGHCGIALEGPRPKLSLWQKTKMIAAHAKIIMTGKVPVEEYEDDEE